MNKYYQLLDKVLLTGKQQENKKGRIHYLLNQQLSLTIFADLCLLDFSTKHVHHELCTIAKSKYRNSHLE